MKFSRKLFSIVSAMSMAACVFASPVFAEDSSTTTSAPVADEEIDTELGELTPDTVAEPNEAPDSVPEASDASSTANYIEMKKVNSDSYFKYDQSDDTFSARFVAESRKFPENSILTYTVRWEQDGFSLRDKSLKIKSNGVYLENFVVSGLEGNPNGFKVVFDEGYGFDGKTIDVNFELKNSKKAKKIALYESAQLTIGDQVLAALKEASDTISLIAEEDDSSSSDSGTITPGIHKKSFVYSSEYDAEKNTLTLNVTLPEEVYNSKKPLCLEVSAMDLGTLKSLNIGNLKEEQLLDYLQSATTSTGQVLKGLKSITFGKQAPHTNLKSWIKDQNIYGYEIVIPESYLEKTMSVVFETEPNIADAHLIAYAYTDTYVSDQIYSDNFGSEVGTTDKNPNSPYSITAGYIQDTNTWDLHISDKDKKDEIDAFPNTSGNTVITVTSDPDVLTGITDFSIGEVGYTVASNDAGITISKKETESAPANVQAPSEGENEDTENETGEVSVLGVKKVSNGYEITIPNADLQTLKTGAVNWIDIVFSTKPDMTFSNMNVVVTNTDNPEAAGSFSEKIKKTDSTPSNSQTNTPGGTDIETNPISSSASFKASHNYDSATQTWTVTLNMTARPAKLDLSFDQKQGTALLKPTSFTINNAAVSPTVNATMSGSTMSVCSVSFSQADLAKVTNGTVVKLVFPVDGSKEQSEKITMTVNTGNASKDLNASFTVKKTTKGGVPTATETGAQPLIIVLIVAVIALAVFGYLAFRKKKKN